VTGAEIGIRIVLFPARRDISEETDGLPDVADVVSAARGCKWLGPDS